MEKRNIIQMLAKKVAPNWLGRQLILRRSLAACPGFTKADLDRCAAEFLDGPVGIGFRNFPLPLEIEERRKSHGSSKYFDFDYWLRVNILRAVALGLNSGSRKRVLDLGCGPGWFLAVCKFHAHEVNGFDLPYCDMCKEDGGVYMQLNRMLGVDKDIRRGRISSFSPLRVDGKFDVITAFMVCFNNHKSEQTWKAEQWKFFLEDIKGHLKAGGTFRMELNPDQRSYPKFKYYDTETKEIFRQFGNVQGSTITLSL